MFEFVQCVWLVLKALFYLRNPRVDISLQAFLSCLDLAWIICSNGLDVPRILNMLTTSSKRLTNSEQINLVRNVLFVSVIIYHVILWYSLLQFPGIAYWRSIFLCQCIQTWTWPWRCWCQAQEYWGHWGNFGPTPAWCGSSQTGSQVTLFLNVKFYSELIKMFMTTYLDHDRGLELATWQCRSWSCAEGGILVLP